MKTNLFHTAIMVWAGVALASAPLSLSAQTTTTSATSSTAPAGSTTTKTKSKYTSYKGTVTELSPTSVSISGKTPLTLMLDSTTSIRKDGKVAQESDFAVGDYVTGSYVKESSGTLLAHSLHKKSIVKKT